LRFVRGVVDSADLPLNVSREKIQESPLLAAIKKGTTSRVFGELERLADKEPQTFAKIWDLFGAVLKEGIYEDFERRDALLTLTRFRTTASDAWRSLKEYVAALRPNQTSIYSRSRTAARRRGPLNFGSKAGARGQSAARTDRGGRRAWRGRPRVQGGCCTSSL
jgi:molecular chaperone HtpG